MAQTHGWVKSSSNQDTGDLLASRVKREPIPSSAKPKVKTAVLCSPGPTYCIEAEAALAICISYW